MSNRFAQTVILLFAVTLSSLAQAPQPAVPQTQTTTETQTLGFAAQIKRTVSLLRVAYLKDGELRVDEGTCFFVYYEDKRLGEHRGFVYLVTNRHVAVPGIDSGHIYPVQWVHLRLNLRQPGQMPASEEGRIPLGGQLHWVFPTDESVDLAVLPVKPDEGRYDYITFPVSLFATKDVVHEKDVAEGDSLLFTGYFYQFPGLKKFQPIVRHGILAMIPDENLDTTLNMPGRLYLADVHVFGGNSGSPMFVNVGGIRNNGQMGGPEYRLLGIISGFYHEDSNLKLTIATTVTGTLEQNSGIAMVVRADELKALLDSPALQEARDAIVSAKKPDK